MASRPSSLKRFVDSLPRGSLRALIQEAEAGEEAE